MDRRACGAVRQVYRMALDAVRGEPWEDRFASLSLVFVRDDQINGLALAAEARRAIAIHLGTPRRVWALMRYALGGTTLLADSFTSPLPEAVAPGPLAAADWVDLYDDPEAAWPSDRYAFLYQLFMYAIDFIVHHELAHHARDHLVLVGDAQIDEGLAMAAAQGGGDDRLRQLIELDADVQALDLMLHADVKRGLRARSGAERLEHAYLLMLSAILVFMAYDLEHRPAPVTYLGSHPAPIHRAMAYTRTVAITFAEEFGLSATDLQEEFEDAWAQAADVAEALGLPRGRWWGSDDLEDFAPRLDVLMKDLVAFTDALDAGAAGPRRGPAG